MNNLNFLLSDKMHEKNITVEKLAEKLGVDPFDVLNLLAGVEKSLVKYEQAFNALGYSLAYKLINE